MAIFSELFVMSLVKAVAFKKIGSFSWICSKNRESSSDFKFDKWSVYSPSIYNSGTIHPKFWESRPLKYWARILIAASFSSYYDNESKKWLESRGIAKMKWHLNKCYIISSLNFMIASFLSFSSFLSSSSFDSMFN